MAGPVAGTLHQALTLSANWHCERPAAGLGYSRASIDGWVLVSESLLFDKSACTVNLLPQNQWEVHVFIHAQFYKRLRKLTCAVCVALICQNRALFMSEQTEANYNN